MEVCDKKERYNSLILLSMWLSFYGYLRLYVDLFIWILMYLRWSNLYIYNWGNTTFEVRINNYNLNGRVIQHCLLKNCLINFFMHAYFRFWTILPLYQFSFFFLNQELRIEAIVLKGWGLLKKIILLIIFES